MKVALIAALVAVSTALHPASAADAESPAAITLKDICINLDTQIEETFESINLMEQDPTAVRRVAVPYQSVEELREIVRARLERIRLLKSVFEENVALWTRLDCPAVIEKQ